MASTRNILNEHEHETSNSLLQDANGNAIDLAGNMYEETFRNWKNKGGRIEEILSHLKKVYQDQAPFESMSSF